MPRNANMKNWGFKTHSESIDEFLDNTAINFVNNKAKHQKGGRIVLPSEYFGSDSGRYSADAPAGSSLAVNENFIREPLGVSDPAGVIQNGGATRSYKISARKFNEAVASAGVALNKAERGALQRAYESKMTELFNSIARRSKCNHMSAAAFQGGLNMAKYKCLN